MKRKLLFYTLSGGIAALVFSSYGGGPLGGGAGNRTGSNSSVADCSTGGCHSANSTATQVTIALTTPGNLPVSSYVPNTLYKVTIGGTNNAAKGKFGFQVSSVKATAQSQQAGSPAVTAPNTIVRTTGGLQIVEHNSPLNATSVTGSTAVYAVSYNWTSPAKGTGSVRFYGILNAVNGTGGTDGDQPNTAPFLEVSEATAAGVPTASAAVLSVFPNPASGEIMLQGLSSGPADIQIWDMSGRVARSGRSETVQGVARMDVSSLAPGHYYLVARQDGRPMVAPFVKR